MPFKTLTQTPELVKKMQGSKKMLRKTQDSENIQEQRVFIYQHIPTYIVHLYKMAMTLRGTCRLLLCIAKAIAGTVRLSQT